MITLNAHLQTAMLNKYQIGEICRHPTPIAPFLQRIWRCTVSFGNIYKALWDLMSIDWPALK